MRQNPVAKGFVKRIISKQQNTSRAFFYTSLMQNVTLAKATAIFYTLLKYIFAKQVMKLSLLSLKQILLIMACILLFLCA